MEPLDLNQFRRKASDGPMPSKPKRLPRHRPGGRFIKGPIPLSWLGRAASLPGKTLHVALAVWYVASLAKQREAKLSRQASDAFGVGREGVAHGLKQLEAAGLVEVARKNGCCPRVTILHEDS